MTIILSDLHLGHTCAKLAGADGLRQLFEGAHEVILNGDSVEQRCDTDEASRHIKSLQEVATRSGAHLRFLTGNHDPHVSEEHFVEFFEGRLLVMHGDAVFPGISPWGRKAGAIANWHLEAVRKEEASGRLSLKRRLEIARAASLQMPVQHWMSAKQKGSFFTILRRVMVPYKAWGIIKCWWEAARLTESFCATYAPQASVIVVGHTHRRGICRRNGRLLVNLGGYLPGSEAYALSIQPSRVLLHAVEVHGGQCRILRGVVADLSKAACRASVKDD